MVKTISKVGNSQGLIFDAALMELSGMRVGDQVNVTLAPGGALIVTPIRKMPPSIEIASAIKKVAKDYRKTLQKLA